MQCLLNAGKWEVLTSEMRKSLLVVEQHIALDAEVKRAKGKTSSELPTTLHEAQSICLNCGCVGKSYIGLFGHSKRCTQPTSTAR